MDPQSTLGVVLAGGQSRRFGSDKALAQWNGTTLLARAVAALEQWCGAVVIAGRADGPAACVADWPRPGMGPLGGLAGGLREAAVQGRRNVLAIGVDSLCLPPDLPALLGPGPACLAAQPVVGSWPVTVLPALEAILLGDGRHSLYALAEATGARRVTLSADPANINTPANLAALRRDT